jgi:formylglycine-generating enzyme required for sulfatase activity
LEGAVRGGGWSWGGRVCRSACLLGYDPGGRYGSLGFRPVADAREEPRVLRGGSCYLDDLSSRSARRCCGKPWDLRWEVRGNRGEDRICRGGCWNWDSRHSPYRYANEPNGRSVILGFRPVAEVKVVPQEEEENRRVCRSTGCRWSSNGCRPACRTPSAPEDRGVCLGFRPVADAMKRLRHVCRGGYWNGTSRAGRSSDRRSQGEKSRDEYLGFRPVAEEKLPG